MKRGKNQTNVQKENKLKVCPSRAVHYHYLPGDLCLLAAADINSDFNDKYTTVNTMHHTKGRKPGSIHQSPSCAVIILIRL